MRSLLLSVIALFWFASIAASNTNVIWSGGVSKEERASAPKTGTKLTFFVQGGDFVAGVDVSVKTRSGQELVNVADIGPWLILDLVDGEYVVVASRDNGDVQSAIIRVDRAGSSEFGFMFPGS